MGLFAATLTSLLMSFPHIFIVALAGIALLGTISHNIAIAFAQIEEREAALFTFYVALRVFNSSESAQHFGDWWSELLYLLFSNLKPKS